MRESKRPTRRIARRVRLAAMLAATVSAVLTAPRANAEASAERVQSSNGTAVAEKGDCRSPDAEGTASGKVDCERAETTGSQSASRNPTGVAPGAQTGAPAVNGTDSRMPIDSTSGVTSPNEEAPVLGTERLDAHDPSVKPVPESQQKTPILEQ